MYEISGVDGRGYPHNIILEIWFELGLIGLFLFLLFAMSSFIYKISKESKTSWIIFLYIILNLLKSNSLVDIRIHLFFFVF
jgi:O-antigen ligase